MQLVALSATVFGEVTLVDQPRKNRVCRARYLSKTVPSYSGLSCVVKVKVKQSHYSPGQALSVQGV
jgi:hypothetical protein